jgi:chemotaxis signal transduction protein
MNTNAEEELRILEQRARSLARPRAISDARATLAVFERLGVRYGIDPRYVFEVARAPRPTALPKSERHWLGVTSLHGELIAIADLPVLLGSDHASTASEHETVMLLVLGDQARELAIEIDCVLEPVSTVDQLAQQPHADAASSLIEGITEDGLRVVRGDLLLADPRLFVQSSSANES